MKTARKRCQAADAWGIVLQMSASALCSPTSYCGITPDVCWCTHHQIVVDTLLGFSIQPSTRQLKSILMRRANSEYVCMYVCMYVCLRLLSMYVCMSHSNLQICLFRRVSKSLSQEFIFFNCEGGYFQEPSQAPNTYVCMHVCLRHTYIHA